MTKAKEKHSFEENFEKLSNLVSELETTKMTLEESLIKYESGISLIEACKKQLDNAEERMQVLNKKTMSIEYALMDELSGGITDKDDFEDGE